MRLHLVIKTALALTLATALTACAVPLNNYGGRSSYPHSRGNQTEPYDIGYRDGYDVGRDDGRNRDRYEPHDDRLYRSADHGYDWRDGSRTKYRDRYRDGFVSGYDQGYRDARSRNHRR